MSTRPYSGRHSDTQCSLSQIQQDRSYSPRQGHDHTSTYAPSPDVEFGNYDSEDLSPRASRYFSKLFTGEDDSESEDAAPLRNINTQQSSTRVQTESVVTLFPSGIVSDQVPRDTGSVQSRYAEQLCPATQGQSFFKKHYRRLKEVHDNGPPGKAQSFLADMNRYWRERKGIAVVEIRSPRQGDGAKPNPTSESAGQSQRMGSSLRQLPLTHGTSDRLESRARFDSMLSDGDISCTSREVPIKIRRTVLEMDLSKPLPKLPPFHATPNQRVQNEKSKAAYINKTLPRTPLDCSSSPKRQKVDLDDSPVDAPWSSTPTHTARFPSTAEQPKAPLADTSNRPHGAEQNAERSWIDDFLSTSSFPLPPTSKPKPSKADSSHDALKAKISRPIPILQTANNRSLPPPQQVNEKIKGKQKANTPSSATWLDKFVHPILPTKPTKPTMPALPTFGKPKKRPHSDDSFVCQGLCESNVYADMVMGGGALSVGCAQPLVGAGKTFTNTSEEDLVPEPLFTGYRSDVSLQNGGDGGVEQRRDGRWL